MPEKINAEEAKFVLDSKGSALNEYMKRPENVEYMVYPKLSALADWYEHQRNKKIRKIVLPE